MEESSWVRSLYLYVMCVVSIALVAMGAVGFVVGAVHTAAPSLGHRDTLDRVGIGLSNVGDKVLDLVAESQSGGVEEFCRDVTDNDDDFESCMDDESGAGEMSAISDGIGEVRSELESQIRNNSIDRMIAGLLAIGVGLVLFRIHGRRTTLFADGLIPKAKPTAAGEPVSEPDAATVTTPPVPPVSLQ